MGMHIRKGGKFMKLKKKSVLMGAVIALSAASLVSVGFASWVISQGDSATVAGTITVDTVSDKSHFIKNAEGGDTLTVTYAAGNSIIFGWNDAGVEVDNPWLLNNNPNMKENLDASVVFYVSNFGSDKASLLSGEVELDGGTAAQQAAFNTAVEDLLIGDLADIEPTFVVDSETTTSFGTSTIVYTKVTCNIKFAWGSYFGMNPYKFYNTKSADEYAEDASLKLAEIAAFSGVGFKLTIRVAAEE